MYNPAMVEMAEREAVADTVALADTVPPASWDSITLSTVEKEEMAGTVEMAATADPAATLGSVPTSI